MKIVTLSFPSELHNNLDSICDWVYDDVYADYLGNSMWVIDVGDCDAGKLTLIRLLLSEYYVDDFDVDVQTSVRHVST
mgnify:CR=1 FL=1